MHEASLLMVHAPWVATAGNASELRGLAETLDKYATAMAAAYAGRLETSEADVLRQLLDGADHWFTGPEAVAAGFADSLIEPASPDSTRAHASPLARILIPRAPARIAAALRSTEQGDPAMPTPAPEAAEFRAAERNRRDQISALARGFIDREGVRALTDRALDDLDTQPEAFGRQLLEHLARDAEPLASAQRFNDAGYAYPSAAPTEGRAFVAAAADALLARAGVRVATPHPAARDFLGTSVVEIARACLSRGGRRDRGFGAEAPENVIRAAMTTSDFPFILENALNKSIRLGMEAPATSHRVWARVTEARDFKEQSRVLLGSAPALKRVPEMAEFENGAMEEDRSTMVPGKWGRIVACSWEALVNDDLGAFLAVGPSLGLAALRAEADSLYSLITESALDGVDMQDGNPLFHASHANSLSVATGTGKPLTAAALGAARAKLRRQTGVGGTLLNLAPRTLLVPPEREAEAEILVASSTIHVGQSAAEAAPGWLSSLQVVAEPRLENTDTVYLVASPQMIDCGEVSVLTGSPFTEQDNQFETKAVRWRIDHSFAVGFLDWRGIVKLTLTA
jgi:hypothetical protein